MEAGTGENAEIATELVEVPPDDGGTSAETTKTKEPENAKPESVRDTAEKAFKELQTKDSSDGQAEPPEEKSALVGKDPKTGKFVNKARSQKITQAQPIDVFMMPAPERFTLEAKQAYQQLPPVLKKELHKTVHDLEAMATRATQETSSIKEAIAPYVDDWMDAKFTPAQAIGALAAAHRRLNNPKTRMQAYIKMGKDLELDFNQVLAAATGQGGTNSGSVTDISSHPQFRGLQEKYNGLESKINSWETQQAAQPIVAEMSAVRDERDAQGAPAFPELQNGEFFNTVKPLVQALVRAVPGMGYGEALRHSVLGIRQDSSSYDNAYRASLYSVFSGTSSQSQAASLPQNATNNNFNQRALNAAVSVRGKTSAPVTGSQVPDNIPNDVRGTVMMAYKALQQGIK